MSERKPWDKRDDETQKSYRAFQMYLRMGPHDRTLKKVHDRIYGTDVNNFPSVRKWSAKYDWTSRVSEYDQHVEEKRRKKYEEEMMEGLSHAGARVEKLKKLHDRLEEELKDHLWLEDVKMSAHGDEKVRIRKYNGTLVKDYLRVLDDIAEEVGGRKKKVDVTSKGKSLDGADVRIVNDSPDPDVKDE
jgi:hypothetical protein